MDPTTYQRLAGRTECNQVKARWRYQEDHIDGATTLPVRLNHSVLGLAGEVGELAGAVEKWLHYGQPLDKANVKEELGDCLWYIALACNALGIDLGDVMKANIGKLQVRYPEKYTDELAAEVNRDRKAERQALEREER